jgi:hypothetical protein
MWPKHVARRIRLLYRVFKRSPFNLILGTARFQELLAGSSAEGVKPCRWRSQPTTRAHPARCRCCADKVVGEELLPDVHPACTPRHGMRKQGINPVNSMTTPSKKCSTRCRARAPRPAAPRCSAALPAATCGAGARRTGGPRPSARSATPTSSAPTARAAASSRRRTTLADAIARAWPRRAGRTATWCCTGGEPLLQVDDAAHRGACTRAASTVAGGRPTARQPAPAGAGLDLRQPQGRCRGGLQKE